jgi:integrase
MGGSGFGSGLKEVVMGSIYQRTPGGVWYYQWYQGNKLHKKSLKTKSRTEAKRLKIRYDAQVDSMKIGLAPKKYKIADAFNKFYRLKEPLLKSGTLERYQAQIAFLTKFLEDKGLKIVNKITHEHIVEYISFRQGQGRSNKTIKEELNLLKAVFKLLIEEGLIAEMPVKRWPKLKTVPKKPETIGAYERSEIKALMEYFSDKEFSDLFLFFLYTGCRRSEAKSLKIRDIKDGKFCIRNVKTESSVTDQHRHIEIHQELLPIMARRAKDKGPGDDVFPEMKKHSRNWPHVQMEKACKALNITYRRLHGIRHTFISSLLAAGVPVRTVMEIVGHENFDTTLRYAHVSQEDIRGKVDRLSFD